MTDCEYAFRQLGPEDIGGITALQEEAFRLLADPSLLRRNSREALLECLQKPHYALGAFLGGELAGFGILYHGGDTDENLSFLTDSPPEPDKCANIKLIIVGEKHRGHGLQRRLIRLLETEAAERGYLMLCATVSPGNMQSLRNFKLMGYIEYRQFTKYGGLQRLLLYRYI